MIKTAEFEGPDGPLTIVIEKKITLGAEGFGAEPSIYPATIVPARYNGSYEGGLGSAAWLAFPVPPHRLSRAAWRGWSGSDIECMHWWEEADRKVYPVGRGASPDGAYADLIRLACKAAGADRADFFEPPTWNREELRGRNDA